MARTAWPTVASGDSWSAAQHNTYGRDNDLAYWQYTTAGDLVYATSSSALTRLGIGTAYQALSVNAGATAPAWTDLSTITANKAMTTSQAAGDVFYASSASALARLAKGSAYQALRMNSGATLPEWGNTWNGCIVQRTTTASIGNGTPVAIGWDNEIIDDYGWHDNVTNSGRITVNADGLYRASTMLHYLGYSGTADYEHAAILYKNGSPLLYDRRSVVTAILDKFITVTYPPISLSNGDYLVIYLEQYSGGTRTLQTDSLFAVERLR